MEFVQTSKGIFMHQKKYALDILKRFKMLDCNSSQVPIDTGLQLTRNTNEPLVDPTLFKQIVGCLRYLCNTRPDISYGVGLVSRFASAPRQSHLTAAKKILRYIKGTCDSGLLFANNTNCSNREIMGFTDSDWCGDREDRKSTSGYLFKFGNTAFSWSSKKQNIVALSSCEAEYVAASAGACQAAWLENLLRELHMIVKDCLLYQ